MQDFLNYSTPNSFLPTAMSEAPSGAKGPGKLRQGPEVPETSDEEDDDGKGGKGGKKVQDLSSGEEALDL